MRDVSGLGCSVFRAHDRRARYDDHETLEWNLLNFGGFGRRTEGVDLDELKINTPMKKFHLNSSP
jgi:hypothetical protein